MKVSSGGPWLLVIAVSFAAMFAGCPLPFDYNGQGAGASHTSDPSTPSLTAAVTVSYAEQGGTSGAIANNTTYTTGKTTTVTLSTATYNSVIYYTDDGSQITNYETPKRINGSSGQITITRSTSVQTLDIHAVATGPNMLPSPASHATVIVSPYPILSVTCDKASVSEDGGTATFTITSSIPPGADLTVTLLTGGTYTTADLTGLPASSTSFSATLVHSATTISLSITGVHNAANANPTVTLTIQPDPNTPPAYTVGAPASASVVIQNDSSHRVTYNGSGNTSGTVPTDGNFYLPGATVMVLGNSGGLVKVGYLFAGWNTKADGSGSTYTQGQTFTMGTSNLTLYAMWGPLLSYTVTYNGNGNTGGTVPTDGNLYLPGATVTVAGNSGNLARSGYTFAGWNTVSDGSGTTYKPAQTFTIGSANVTVYAMWGPLLEGGSIQGHALTLSGAVTTQTTGMSNPCFATTDGTYVYFSDESSGKVSKMDLSGNTTVLATIADVQGIVTDGTYLYVTSYASGKVEKVNASTGTWSDLTTALPGPCGITLDGGYLYVVCNGGGSSKVYKIDKASGASVVLATGLSNIAVGITTDGSYLYVTESPPPTPFKGWTFPET